MAAILSNPRGKRGGRGRHVEGVGLEPVEGFGVDVVASDADLRGALDAIGADAVFVAVGVGVAYGGIFYGVLPFIITDILRLAILIMFPIIALYLPSQMK